MRTRNHNVGYRYKGNHYRTTMNTRTILAMLAAGTTFQYRGGPEDACWVGANSASHEIRKLLEQDLIWWGNTISRGLVIETLSHTALSVDSDARLMEMYDSTRSALKQAIKTPSTFLTKLSRSGRLPEGITTVLEMLRQISNAQHAASSYSTTGDGSDTTNQNTQNQENTTMSTNYPTAGLTISSAETKAGWVGQVKYDLNIVWESQPVPNDTVFDNDCVTAESFARQLAADAVAEFYRTAFDEVTVTGFTAKAKGKK